MLPEELGNIVVRSHCDGHIKQVTQRRFIAYLERRGVQQLQVMHRIIVPPGEVDKYICRYAVKLFAQGREGEAI